MMSGLIQNQETGVNFFLLLYLNSGSDMRVMITGDNCGKDKINLHFRSPFLTARTTGGIY